MLSIDFRLPRAGDYPRLIEIDNAGTRLLADHGYPQLLDGSGWDLPEFSVFVDAHECRVAVLADGTVAGFAAARPIGNCYWLRELGVDPALGRKGIGTRLLETMVDLGAGRGFTSMGLSTFDDVAFNRPFYERRGFDVADPDSAEPALARQFRDEVLSGIDPASRVLMFRAL